MSGTHRGSRADRAGKHPFQLLKTLSVEKKKFVFNVDLLHPREQDLGDDLFQDIFDLGIRETSEGINTVRMKSIALPSSHIIFDYDLWSAVLVDGVLPTGAPHACQVPLMDEAGLILSKSVSVKQLKRGRDAFDIYFVLSAQNALDTAGRLHALARSVPAVSKQIDDLRQFIGDMSGEFNSRVGKYVHLGERDDPAGQVLKMLSIS